MQESSSRVIALSAGLNEYFREPVQEAFKDAAVDASGATQTYLVQLLSDFANPTKETASPLSESVTLLYHDAMRMAGQERFRRLQQLGDGVLYVVGYFHGPQLQGSDEAYVAGVGRNAYGHAARMLRTGQGSSHGPDVLEELARSFDRFVAVLRYVSDWVFAKSQRDEEGLVRLYDRWRRTGSTVLRNELGQRGLIPTSGPEGVH